MRRTLCTQLRARRNAPRNSTVGRQRGNHSNNKLSRHLVGILTSYWRLLLGQATCLFVLLILLNNQHLHGVTVTVNRQLLSTLAEVSVACTVTTVCPREKVALNRILPSDGISVTANSPWLVVYVTNDSPLLSVAVGAKNVTSTVFAVAESNAAWMSCGQLLTTGAALSAVKNNIKTLN